MYFMAERWGLIVYDPFGNRREQHWNGAEQSCNLH